MLSQSELKFPLPLKSEETGFCDEWWHLFDLGDITLGTVKKYKWIQFHNHILPEDQFSFVDVQQRWQRWEGQPVGKKWMPEGEKNVSWLFHKQ